MLKRLMVRGVLTMAAAVSCLSAHPLFFGARSLEAQASTKPKELCVLPSNTAKLYYSHCEAEGGRRVTFQEPPLVQSNTTKIGNKLTTTPVSPGQAMTSPDSKACHDGWNTHLAIGDSFNDLNFLNTVNCNAALAKGAQFSWADDRVAPNIQWTAKGVVAGEFIWIGGPDGPPTGPYLNMFSVAPYVNFQSVTNSNLKMVSQNVDVLTYGFSSEALYDRVFGVWQTYLRARASINSDFEGLTHSWSATGEFQPLSDAYFIGRNIPVGAVDYFWFLPLVRAQYFQKVEGSTDPIFNHGNEVFRVGPVISLNFVPQDTTNVDPSKAAPAPKWLLNLTYSWYVDLLSQQTFYNLNPSLTYNFTDNVGVSLAYQVGKIDETGKKVNLTTLGLTVRN
jgi:hypothetical protein